MSIRLLRGDCRETLAALEPGSIQACITSPPYWGLRSYGTPDLVWGGDAEHAHSFGVAVRGPWANELPSAATGRARASGGDRYAGFNARWDAKQKDTA